MIDFDMQWSSPTIAGDLIQDVRSDRQGSGAVRPVYSAESPGGFLALPADRAFSGKCDGRESRDSGRSTFGGAHGAWCAPLGVGGAAVPADDVQTRCSRRRAGPQALGKSIKQQIQRCDVAEVPSSSARRASVLSDTTVRECSEWPSASVNSASLSRVEQL